jgi:hypothetical protein
MPAYSSLIPAEYAPSLSGGAPQAGLFPPLPYIAKYHRGPLRNTAPAVRRQLLPIFLPFTLTGFQADLMTILQLFLLCQVPWVWFLYIKSPPVLSGRESNRSLLVKKHIINRKPGKNQLAAVQARRQF